MSKSNFSSAGLKLSLSMPVIVVVVVVFKCNGSWGKGLGIFQGTNKDFIL